MKGREGQWAWLSDSYALPAQSLCLKPGKAGLCCKRADHEGGHVGRKGVVVRSHRPGEPPR